MAPIPSAQCRVEVVKTNSLKFRVRRQKMKGGEKGI